MHPYRSARPSLIRISAATRAPVNATKTAAPTIRVYAERRSQDKRRRGTNRRRENRRISVHSILRAFRDPRAFVLQKKRPREAAVMAVLG
jgi:hypothetical protein